MIRALRLTSTLVALLLAGTAAVSEPRSALGAAGSTESLQFPDTSAGRAFQQLLTAFNAGNVEALRAFHREYSPADRVEAHTALDLQAFAQTGGIDPVSIARSEEYELAFVGRTRLTEM